MTCFAILWMTWPLDDKYDKFSIFSSNLQITHINLIRQYFCLVPKLILGYVTNVNRSLEKNIVVLTNSRSLFFSTCLPRRSTFQDSINAIAFVTETLIPSSIRLALAFISLFFSWYHDSLSSVTVKRSTNSFSVSFRVLSLFNVPFLHVSSGPNKPMSTSVKMINEVW